MRQFLTPHISVTAEPTFMKLEAKNYHMKTTHHPKLYIDPMMWVVWANTQFATVWVICLSFLFFGFLVTCTNHTSGPILMVYTSYNVLPCKDVPFRGCIDTDLHLGGPVAPKPQFLWCE